MSERSTSNESELRRVYEELLGFDDLGEEYERVVRQVFDSVTSEGDTAADVGAHTGKHTLPLALAVGSTGQVFAFEPLRWAADRLEERIRKSDLDTKISLFRGCCGSEVLRSLTFSEVVDRPGWSSKNVRPDAGDVATSDVPQTTLDTVLDGGAIRVMKVDVEGAEIEVLLGAQEAIQRSKPVIHLEISPAAIASFGGTDEDIRGFLVENGYEIFDLLGIDITAQNMWRASVDTPGFFDVIAVHQHDPAKDAVSSVLSNSFRPERDDVLVSIPRPVIEMARPLRATSRWVPSTDLVSPLVSPQPTVFPTVPPAARLVRDGSQWALLDLSSGAIKPISGDETRFGLPVCATVRVAGDLSVAVEMREVPGASTTQTLLEVRLGDVDTAVIRILPNNQLQVVHFQNRRAQDAQTMPAGKRRAYRIEWSLANGRFAVSVCGIGRSRDISLSLDEQAPELIEITYGARRFWSRPDSVRATSLPIRVVNPSLPNDSAMPIRVEALKSAKAMLKKVR